MPACFKAVTEPKRWIESMTLYVFQLLQPPSTLRRLEQMGANEETWLRPWCLRSLLALVSRCRYSRIAPQDRLMVLHKAEITIH